MLAQQAWLQRRAVQEGWGEDHWRQVELFRIALARMGLELQATEPELTAIFARKEAGVFVGEVLDESEPFPLFEALKRLTDKAQTLLRDEP